MTKLKKLLRVIPDCSGATAIEYALIAGVICLAIVAGATSVGQQTNGTFTELNTRAFGS